jgi:hypothetical protein
MKRPTPIFDDEIDRHIAGMRSMLGILEQHTAARACVASREAVQELEDVGEVGCPLCGSPAAFHLSEVPSHG